MVLQKGILILGWFWDNETVRNHNTTCALAILSYDLTTLYCIISNMKMIVQFHIFRPKFSHQNSLFVHKLRTTIVKLNSVSQKQFLVSTVVLMTALPLKRRGREEGGNLPTEHFTERLTLIVHLKRFLRRMTTPSIDYRTWYTSIVRNFSGRRESRMFCGRYLIEV